MSVHSDLMYVCASTVISGVNDIENPLYRQVPFSEVLIED